MSEELELTGASTTRRRRILRGDLKVTPLRRLTYIDQYQGQVVLTPGRSRLDPTHPCGQAGARLVRRRFLG